MRRVDTVTANPARHAEREITAHFAGRASPAREAAMRAHLPQCASCRRYYDRHWLLAGLDPRGVPAEQRIARGLGISAAGRATPDAGPRTRRTRRFLIFASPVFAAAALLCFVRWHAPPATPASDGLQPRGSGGSAPSFWIYRLAPGAPPQLVEGGIHAGDELAFAYANPGGSARLAIFGVDEHRHVYWFHPAWMVGQAPPVAIPARAGPGPHELPDAVRHRLDARHLTIYALFSERPVSALAAEAWARRDGARDDLAPFGERAVVLRRSLEVLR